MPFTPETAATYGKMGQVARIASLERAKNMPKFDLAATPTANPSPHAQQSIEQLEFAMSRIDAQMREAKKSDDWQKLSTARLRLFSQWQVLTGLANPGSRRPGTERPKRREPLVSPISSPLEPGPVSQPDPAPAAAPVPPADDPGI